MLTGKGIYLWRIKDCEGGVISDIVTMAKKANFSHVIIKIADGTVGYNFTEDDGDMAKALAQALQAVDIEPWGWQYIFGRDPVGEAKTATRRMRETGCVGFVINAEKEIRDIADNDTVVGRYFDGLHETDYWAEIPIALSSYRYPEVHPKFPWQAFIDWLGCENDFMMPQVYWKEAHNPAFQLRECLRQYAKITDLPILPTGSAYCASGWCPTNEEIEEFACEALGLGLPGINFWEWKATRAGGFWHTVKDINYQTEPSPINCDEQVAEAVKQAQDECREQIAVLNKAHEEKMLELVYAHKLVLEETEVKANNTALENLIKPYLK